MRHGTCQSALMTWQSNIRAGRRKWNARDGWTLPGRDPAGDGPSGTHAAAPASRRGHGAMWPLAAIRQVMAHSEMWPAVRPCRFHGRKPRLWLGRRDVAAWPRSGRCWPDATPRRRDVGTGRCRITAIATSHDAAAWPRSGR
jgi:hypothetical protein